MRRTVSAEFACGHDNGGVTARIFTGRPGPLSGRAARLLDEARRAFPSVGADTRQVFLPTERLEERCRICGTVGPLTKEHVPPASAFNEESANVHTAEEWLARGGDGELPGGELQHGGIWGYTLCERCNNLTGGYYGEEYKLWAYAIVQALRDAGVDPKVLDALEYIPDGPLRLTAYKKRSPRPGAFVRQALSIMCTLSANFDLAGRYPAIRRSILEKSTEALPEGMSLGLTGYIGGYPRVIGPQIVARVGEGSWHCLMELAVPPLAILMVLGGNSPYRHTFDLTPFAEMAPGERRDVEGRLAVAIGYTMYPGDYRTKAMVEREAAENERAASV